MMEDSNPLFGAGWSAIGATTTSAAGQVKDLNSIFSSDNDNNRASSFSMFGSTATRVSSNALGGGVAGAGGILSSSSLSAVAATSGSHHQKPSSFFPFGSNNSSASTLNNNNNHHLHDSNSQLSGGTSPGTPVQSSSPSYNMTGSGGLIQNQPAHRFNGNVGVAHPQHHFHHHNNNNNNHHHHSRTATIDLSSNRRPPSSFHDQQGAANTIAAANLTTTPPPPPITSSAAITSGGINASAPSFIPGANFHNWQQQQREQREAAERSGNGATTSASIPPPPSISASTTNNNNNSNIVGGWTTTNTASDSSLNNNNNNPYSASSSSSGYHHNQHRQQLVAPPPGGYMNHYNNNNNNHDGNNNIYGRYGGVMVHQQQQMQQQQQQPMLMRRTNFDNSALAEREDISGVVCLPYDELSHQEVESLGRCTIGDIRAEPYIEEQSYHSENQKETIVTASAYVHQTNSYRKIQRIMVGQIWMEFIRGDIGLDAHAVGRLMAFIANEPVTIYGVVPNDALKMTQTRSAIPTMVGFWLSIDKHDHPESLLDLQRASILFSKKGLLAAFTPQELRRLLEIADNRRSQGNTGLPESPMTLEAAKNPPKRQNSEGKDVDVFRYYPPKDHKWPQTRGGFHPFVTRWEMSTKEDEGRLGPERSFALIGTEMRNLKAWGKRAISKLKMVKRNESDDEIEVQYV